MPESLLIRLQASVGNSIKKEIRVQVFRCEFCEMFKNTFFTEHLQKTVSVFKYSLNNFRLLECCKRYLDMAKLNFHDMTRHFSET